LIQFFSFSNFDLISIYPTKNIFQSTQENTQESTQGYPRNTQEKHPTSLGCSLGVSWVTSLGVQGVIWEFLLGAFSWVKSTQEKAPKNTQEAPKNTQEAPKSTQEAPKDYF